VGGEGGGGEGGGGGGGGGGGARTTGNKPISEERKKKRCANRQKNNDRTRGAGRRETTMVTHGPKEMGHDKKRQKKKKKGGPAEPVLGHSERTAAAGTGRKEVDETKPRYWADTEHVAITRTKLSSAWWEGHSGTREGKEGGEEADRVEAWGGKPEERGQEKAHTQGRCKLEALVPADES